MKYLLDTNICVFFFRGKYDMLNILRNKGFKNCYISEITVAELRYGAEKSASPPKQHALIDAFTKIFAFFIFTTAYLNMPVSKPHWNLKERLSMMILTF